MGTPLIRPHAQAQRLNCVSRRAICLACALVAAATGTASAQQSTYVNVEKIRAALLRPPSNVTFEYRQPDFSIHIQERRPLDDVFDAPLWETGPVARSTPAPLAHIEGTPGNTPALVQASVDPTGFARSARKTAQARATRTQTQRAISQYCAAQPDAGLSIPLCWAYSSTP